MILQSEIKSILENVFDIPFEVAFNNNQDAPEFKVRPADNKDYLFDINAKFFNQIRFVMSFEPQKYGAEMVREMGRSSEEQKKIFSAYARRMAKQGAKMTMKINQLPMNPEAYNEWPGEWTKVDLKSSIIPIEFDLNDAPDYRKTIMHWLPLMMGISLSLLDVEKIDEHDEQGYAEGKKYDVVTNRYERNPINRVLCLNKYGYKCSICGFNFEKTYGDIGKEFIHVHHKIPVSQMGENYIVDPENDLIPVCPNCHAMLHKSDPPMAVEELMTIIRNKKFNI